MRPLLSSPSPKPLLIPPEILSAPGTKLPEKLLLALYLDDPKRKPPLRSMSMTKAGLAKLEARLGQKRLLIFSGGQHIVHIPGLAESAKESIGHSISAYAPAATADKLAQSTQTNTHASAQIPHHHRDNQKSGGQSISSPATLKPGKNLALHRPPAHVKRPPMPKCAGIDNDHTKEGHIVADCGQIETANNLASPQPRPHLPTVVPLVIPAELLQFRYLSASEKILLAHYAAHLCAQNRHIINTLKLSKSGLKLLKQGLIRKHVLVPHDAGFTVRLPGLILVHEPQGSHFVPESAAAKTDQKMAPPPPRLTPANEIFKEWKACLLPMERKMDFETRTQAFDFTVNMVKRVEVETPEGRERDYVLSIMKRFEDNYFLENFVFANCPRKHERTVMSILKACTPGQRAALRVQAEGMLLADTEPKLLTMFTTVTSTASEETL